LITGSSLQSIGPSSLDDSEVSEPVPVLGAVVVVVAEDDVDDVVVTVSDVVIPSVEVSKRVVPDDAAAEVESRESIVDPWP
jgi:hypothetical protein